MPNPTYFTSDISAVQPIEGGLVSGALRSLDVARPVLIVTARASLDEVDYTRLPADVYVFREGDIDNEDHYWFGRDVAAWFVPPRLASLQHALRTLYRGDYRLGAVLTDRSRARQVINIGFDSLGVDFEPEDWNDYLIESPNTARLLAEPHPPSLLIIMLGTALSLGFRKVLVLDGQHGGSKLRKLQQSILTENALLAGLRSRSRVAHSYELGDLARLQKTYPDASILDAGTSEPFAQFLSHAQRISDDHMLPTPKATSRPATNNELFALRPSPGAPKRCAYVTYFDDDGYFWGALALAGSLAKVSDYPLIALVPSTYQLPEVASLPRNMTIVRAPRIRNELFAGRHQERFECTFSKLGVFALTFLDRGVYLDADTVILQNIDDLFDREGFSAAPDFGFDLRRQIFNSGVFGFTPSADTFRDMMDQNGRLPSYDGGDQGFLNSYFADIEWLDSTYNTLWRMIEANPGLVDLDSIRVLHFVGPKPWSAALTSLPEWLIKLWLDHLDRDYLGHFTMWRVSQQRLVSEPTEEEPDDTLEPQEKPEPNSTGTTTSPGAERWQRPLELVKVGQLDAAERMVNRSLKKYPNSVRTLRVKALIHRKRGEYGRWARTWVSIVRASVRRAIGQ